MDLKNRIVVALDGISAAAAAKLVTLLSPLVWGFKMNDLFLDPLGPALARIIVQSKAKLWLDLKLHDIPNTVKNQLNRLANYMPSLVTVHASGGIGMLTAACETARDARKSLHYTDVGEVPELGILAVSVLTSLSAEECEKIYGSVPAEKVPMFATLARDAGVWGAVCSGHEARQVRDLGLRPVVPGIRPEWFLAEQNVSQDDQKRVVTPCKALDFGAELLVIGRPIVKSEDPLVAVERTISELEDNYGVAD